MALRTRIDYSKHPMEPRLPHYTFLTDPVKRFNARSLNITYGTEAFANQQPAIQQLFYSPENLEYIKSQLRAAGYAPLDDNTIRGYQHQIWTVHPPFGEHARFETDMVIQPGQYAQVYLEKLNRLLLKDLVTEYASSVHSRKLYLTDLCRNRGLDIPNPQNSNAGRFKPAEFAYNQSGYNDTPPPFYAGQAYDNTGFGRCL